MQTQVMIRDEIILRAGPPPIEFVLAVPEHLLTVRELIRARVEQEVATFNEQHPEYFQGLVQPGVAERTLNGFRMPRQHHVDAAEQVQLALYAFEHNGFVILINDQQVEHLDAQVLLDSATVVTFLKLVPLVGG